MVIYVQSVSYYNYHKKNVEYNYNNTIYIIIIIHNNIILLKPYDYIKKIDTSQIIYTFDHQL